MRAAPGLQIGAPGKAGSRGAAVHGADVLARGALPAGPIEAGAWHRLRLNVSAATVTAEFDGRALLSSPLRTTASIDEGYAQSFFSPHSRYSQPWRNPIGS